MRLPVAARSLKRRYLLELGMSMMVPHNLSIMSMTKVNIGQIGGKNSSMRGVVGSSSSMTLSAKHLSILKSDNPTLLQGRRESGERGCPSAPQNFLKSVNSVSIRGWGEPTTCYTLPTSGISYLPTALLLITIFMALLLCQ